MSVVEPQTLYLVATPLGNLSDVTLRAIEVLKAVALIACEDTRHSRVLLDAHGISTKTTSLPAFAERDRVHSLIERLKNGESIALISDAGSPAISDPGEFLVAECVRAGLRVIPIPGASAVIAALSASGLPSSRFHFLGFLPRGELDAKSMLDEVSGLSATLVLYESPRRIAETLGRLRTVLGDRRACVARELTKLHEEITRGSLFELEQRFARDEPLGEFVVVVEGRGANEKWAEAEVMQAIHSGLARGERLKPLSLEVAKQAGWPSQDVYRLGVGLKDRGRSPA